jgi:LacI family transcriptional regulator
LTDFPSEKRELFVARYSNRSSNKYASTTDRQPKAQVILYTLFVAIRMKDIAQDLGLSVVTVSKVLRDHPDIGEETRQRVLKRVQELDYQPNVLARSLVTGHSYLVGLVVPGLLHPFFAEVAKALSTVIRAKGYSLIVSSSEEDPELERQEIRQLLARRLDALVIASSGTSIEQFQRMDLQSQPYVLIDREFPELNANFVGIDDTAAGRIATEHLIDVGCKRVAHIGGRENSTGIRRFDGYKQALEKRGIAYSDEYVVSRMNVDTESTEQGAEAMRLLLQCNPRPDGVFCHNDPLAIGAMNTILDAGLKIPEDIAIIGCGNLHYDNCLRVGLSSIDQHSEQIGQLAAEIVLGLIESREMPAARTVILEPALVTRASTKRV